MNPASSAPQASVAAPMPRLDGLRVGFAGTPEFAATALAALLAAGADVPLVLTQPDRPAGRGMKLQASPVKQLAQQHGIAVAQPRSLRLDGKYPEDAQAAQAAMQAAACDVWVVAAYGLILPRWVLELATEPPPGSPKAVSAPPGGSEPRAAGSVGATSTEPPPVRPKAASGLGCLNIHASLLPRWRGAAPIHRAIEAGDTETGITIMQMDEGLDTGDMLLVAREPIHASDTTGSLHDRLARLGGDLIVQALSLLTRGELKATPQPAVGITYAHKIDKAEALIDWSQPAALIERRVRAFNPFPGASTTLGGEPLKVWGCEVPNSAQQSSFDSKVSNTDEGNGVVLSTEPGALAVRTGDGVLRLTELQRAGGKRLAAADFLRGTPLNPGAVLG